MATPPAFRRLTYPDRLSVLVSDKSSDLKHLIGIRQVLSPAEVDRILAHVRQMQDAEWSLARHVLHPTTDVETASIPWLDEMLQRHLRSTLLPTIAQLFQVQETQL